MDVLTGKKWATLDESNKRDNDKSPKTTALSATGKSPQVSTRPDNRKLIIPRQLPGEGKLFNDEINLNFALLDQYELYVAAMNQAVVMQIQANRFFLTFNTLIIGFIASMTLLATNPAQSIWLVYICITGIFLTVTWFVSRRTHRVANASRLQTIQALETNLPANIYLRERHILSKEQRSRAYGLHASLEQMIPYGHGLLYTMMAISLFFVGS